MPEEAQQNIRILRGWAKSKGWEMKPNPQGGPEIWGVKVDGRIDWRLKIKPEVSPRAGSDFPRFDARINSGKNPNNINPFTSQIGNKTIGTHINLETLNYSLANKLDEYDLPRP